MEAVRHFSREEFRALVQPDGRVEYRVSVVCTKLWKDMGVDERNERCCDDVEDNGYQLEDISFSGVSQGVDEITVTVNADASASEGAYAQRARRLGEAQPLGSGLPKDLPY